MIYYKRFIGDYRSKTSSLSPLEVGIYDLMLDEYYALEAPIVGDSIELFRLCRAHTETEQRAVIKIRDRFFTPTGDGRLRNKRADEQIRAERRHSQQQTDAANARWERERARKAAEVLEAGQTSLEIGTESADAPHGGAHGSTHPPRIETPPAESPPVQEDGCDRICRTDTETMVSTATAIAKRKETHLSDCVGPGGGLSTTRQLRPMKTSRIGDPPGFPEFWRDYPRHDARKAAAAAWLRLKPSEQLRAQIHAAIAWQRRTGCLRARVVDNRSTIPMAATWLNGERWRDEQPNLRPAPPPVDPEVVLENRINELWGEVKGCVQLGTKPQNGLASGPGAEALAAVGGLDELRSLGRHALLARGSSFAAAYRAAMQQAERAQGERREAAA